MKRQRNTTQGKEQSKKTEAPPNPPKKRRRGNRIGPGPLKGEAEGEECFPHSGNLPRSGKTIWDREGALGGWGFSGGSEVKASPCSAGDLGLFPGLGRSPEKGNGNPLKYSCLENPMEGEVW